MCAPISPTENPKKQSILKSTIIVIKITDFSVYAISEQVSGKAACFQFPSAHKCGALIRSVDIVAQKRLSFSTSIYLFFFHFLAHDWIGLQCHRSNRKNKGKHSLMWEWHVSGKYTHAVAQINDNTIFVFYFWFVSPLAAVISWRTGIAGNQLAQSFPVFEYGGRMPFIMHVGVRASLPQLKHFIFRFSDTHIFVTWFARLFDSSEEERTSARANEWVYCVCISLIRLDAEADEYFIHDTFPNWSQTSTWPLL